jgi:hypothetical protein
MAIIYNYPLNSILLADDMLIGTSTKIVNGQPKNATKNFSIADLTGFIKQNVSLNDVLLVGNASLLDAKIGKLYLYDTPVADYGNIALNQNRFSFNTVTHGEVFRAQRDMFSSFSSAGYRGSFEVSGITANRVWGFPDKSGTVALLSDVPSGSVITALPFTTDHISATGNQYVIGDVVWYLGNVYRCIASNDSLLPTNTLYWTNLGAGYPLVQEPADWNSTSGNNQILNKPTIGNTPTLQEVTDEGNVTTNPILLEQTGTQVELGNNGGFPYFKMLNIESGQATLFDNSDNTDSRYAKFQDKNGTLAYMDDITAPTLQEVLDNNHDLVDGNNFQGTGAGLGNTGTEVNALGVSAAENNIGNNVNALGNGAANNNEGINVNALGTTSAFINGGNNVNGLGFQASYVNSGNNVNGLGNSAALSNTGNDVNAFGFEAGVNNLGNGNTFNNVNLFGQSATADEDGQTVLSKDGSIMARISTTDLTATRKYNLPDADGTLALTTDIPTLQEVTTEGNETVNSIKVIDTGNTSTQLQANGIVFDDLDDLGSTFLSFQQNSETFQQVVEIRPLGGTIALLSDIPTGGGIPHATASGTDTYTATITGVASYADGDAYLIRFPNGNTTSATLNINGLGAITLYRNNDGPLIGGDILDGGEMICVYNSTTTAFQCIGTAPNSLFAYVTNADSVTITKGQVVYAFGGQGDRMTVKLANNVGDSTSAQTVGVVLSTSIAANQKGVIITQGLLDGLSILPTATFSDGDPLYLGATAGSITNIKPYAPNHLVYLGNVTTASNGASGRWYVRVQNGYELDELHNVQAQAPSLNDTLWYDNTVSPAQWKTASISTVLGFTPENVANKENTTLDTSTTKYPTNRLTKEYADAKVTDAITNGVTTIAPSQNAVFDALALKADAYPNYPFNTTTNYFGLFNIAPTISAGVVIGSTANNTNNAVAFNRFSVDKEITISDFAILQNAANDGASATVTLYIFDDTNAGLPGVKLHQETTATGILTPAQKYISFTNNITLQKGNYWIALHFRGLNTAGTNPSFIGGLVNQPNVVTSIASYNVNFRPLITGATADLSNNPSITLGAVQNLPQIFIKI